MTLSVAWIGQVPYREALRMQRARRRGVIEDTAPDTLWLVEHHRVVTTGRRHTQLDPRLLGDLDVVETERGGLATWHGPGQLVGYLIADVQRLGHGVKSTVAALEDGLVRWLRSVGLDAGRREGYPGVWVDGRKIASVGLHFRRGVSLHGFALNLTADLADFDRFTPCGIDGVRMTSVQDLLGASPTPVQAWEPVAEAVLAALELGRWR